MRGILVVNHSATATTPRVRDVLVHALADEVDLDIVTTDHRGHAAELGRRAREERMDVVVTLGGDGTINEVVNGLLEHGPGPDVPMIATVPGGSANVFPRALGLPADPVEATGELLDGLREKRTRTLGLGRANGRWFTVNAGLGLDAEIVAAMERQRGEGRAATPGRYFATTLREFFVATDRRTPALRVVRPGLEPVEGVFLAIVQNTSPWTYLGRKAVDPCPLASFDTGLDLFAVRRLGVATSLRTARRMLARSTAGSTRKSLTVLHDQPEFTVESDRPVAFQVDGEGLGEIQRVTFRAVPEALRAVV
ncbi:MAG: diacylglycerol kinase family protein [Candidatus Nanopelagicales bacterium]